MNKLFWGGIFAIIFLGIVLGGSKPSPSATVDQTAGWQTYASSMAHFAIKVPQGYAIHEKDQESFGWLNFPNVEFTIPASIAEGTNLGSDTHINVAEVATTTDCTANIFLGNINGMGKPLVAQKVVDGDRTYSVATVGDAALGNRYDFTAYAISGTNPCVAVVYSIHYGVIDNYPPGMVKEFDRKALMDQFDNIRRTLILSNSKNLK